MPGKPKRGASSRGGGGGGGGGFLQGLFGPSENLDYGKEQGDADFSNPVPVEQKYSTPTGWQKFFAPQQSALATRENLGAIENQLLTKQAEAADLNRLGLTQRGNVDLENLRAGNQAAAAETARLHGDTAAREAFDVNRKEVRDFAIWKAAQEEAANQNKLGFDYRALAPTIPGFDSDAFSTMSPEQQALAMRGMQLQYGANANQAGFGSAPSLLSRSIAENRNQEAQANAQRPTQSGLAEAALKAARLANVNSGIISKTGQQFDEFGKHTGSVVAPFHSQESFQIPNIIMIDPVTKQPIYGKPTEGNRTVVNPGSVRNALGESLMPSSGVLGSGGRQVVGKITPPSGVSPAPQVLTKPTRGELTAEQNLLRENSPGFLTQMRNLPSSFVRDEPLIDFSSALVPGQERILQDDLRKKQQLDWLKRKAGEFSSKYFLTK